MTTKKEGVNKCLNSVEQQAAKLLEKVRIEWLQEICRDATEKYNFSSLSELVAFMFNHKEDLTEYIS